VTGGEESLEKLVRGYIIKNAVKHGGQAKVGSVMSMILGDRPDLKPRAREIAKLVKEMIDEINSMSLEELKRILEEEYPWLAEEKREEEKRGEEELPPLPGAEEGKVVTRFAPNPDFVIHLGNARPAILSDEYAKMYKGRMILRFEDTDPRTKTPLREAYDLIKEDLRWLGVEWHEEHIQSMRMEIFYDVAREMVRRGCAYVDTCGDRSRELLRKGSYCETRDYPPEWHLEEFEKMIRGEYGEGEAVLRVKTDPRHPNPSVRDWVAFRIIDPHRYPHPLVGSRYYAWPTYNFAVSVDDYMMGVTHVLRGKEHQVNTEKQLYVYRCMGWKPPVFVHFGRLKLEGFIMSKSYIRKLLEENPDKFLGYDDPRFGTIAGLRRRGILPEAIRRIILRVGVKPGDAKISWANLAALNRKLLDPIADRLMYVWEPVELRLEGVDECIVAEIPYHPDRPERKRIIRVCPGDTILVNRGDAEKGELRLLGLANVSIENGKAVVTGFDVEEARKKRLPIVQWVPKEGAVSLEVLEPVELEFNVYRGYAEPALREYGVDARLQLIRFGFIRIDEEGPEGYKAFLTHR